MVYYYLLIMVFLIIVGTYTNQVWGILCMSDSYIYNLELHLNQVSVIFTYLVLIVSLLILVYSVYYMATDAMLEYYLITMFIFMISMVCLMLAVNWTLMLLGWEGLGMSSFFLINFNMSWESHGNAFTTLMTMRMGDAAMFFFLSEFFYLSYYSMSLLMNINIFLFVMFAMTKSALFPFSGWLPKAMSAPTPTSALVHSSTLVTAGLVLIMHHSEALMNNMSMFVMLLTGLLTMMTGSLTALVESSVKKVVAYSTLSQMGLAMMVYGAGYFYLGFINLIAHGFAKSLLFMQIGYLMHLKYNKQNMRKWGDTNFEGLLQLQLVITSFSLCGVGFMSGMLMKEFILESVLSSLWSLVLIFSMNAFIYMTFLYCILIYKSLFVSEGFMVQYNQKSYLMLLLITVEVFLVISLGAYITLNMVMIHLNYSYFEVMIPIMIMVMLGMYYFTIMNINMYNENTTFILYVNNNYMHYPWLKYTLNLALIMLDKCLFYSGLSSGKHLLSLSFSTKLGLVGSFNNLVLLILFFMLVLV